MQSTRMIQLSSLQEKEPWQMATSLSLQRHLIKPNKLLTQKDEGHPYQNEKELSMSCRWKGGQQPMFNWWCQQRSGLRERIGWTLVMSAEIRATWENQVDPPETKPMVKMKCGCTDRISQFDTGEKRRTCGHEDISVGRNCTNRQEQGQMLYIRGALGQQYLLDRHKCARPTSCQIERYLLVF